MKISNKLLLITCLGIPFLYLVFIGVLLLKPELGIFLPLITFVFCIFFTIGTPGQARDELKIERQHEFYENPLFEYPRIKMLLEQDGKHTKLLMELQIFVRMGLASVVFFALLIGFFFS